MYIRNIVQNDNLIRLFYSNDSSALNRCIKKIKEMTVAKCLIIEQFRKERRNCKKAITKWSRSCSSTSLTANGTKCYISFAQFKNFIFKLLKKDQSVSPSFNPMSLDVLDKS
ncbi:hypothetical protein BpHYR1_047899 [Brachionus plicatilis]|uniref:Uncharacterized protein n=1 Tax=Brachionus plicatilis TaxID=10195 RepID=A0A3M7PH62_BRAPC|nr:hypothetical protein BpHYR1_047899 [Brachionus plicatilis]